MTDARRPILSGWLYMPLERLAGVDLAALKRALLHHPPPGDEDRKPIPLYTEQLPSYLGVARAYGLAAFADRLDGLDDRTSRGREFACWTRLPAPDHPRVRNPEAQARFMADLHAAALAGYGFNATAPTGSGKTVCALHAVARLGRATLILVHLERLMHQWVEEIQDKLGVPRDQIGLLQGDVAQWERPVVVGMLHTLNLRRYPREFYRGFGTVVFDEVHKVGCPFFAPAVTMFPARHRIGLSATMERRDRAEKVFFWHIGPVAVSSSAEYLPMRVFVKRYSNPRHAKWGRTREARVKCLSLDRQRNVALARLVHWMWGKGRHVLAVADGIDQLEAVMALAEAAGVPRADMGLFAGQRTEGGRRVAQKKTELDRVKESARIIFGTYGMLTEGIDIPRLDAGIDLTPRSKATQVTGRIRRVVPGKPTAVWTTLLDTDCPMSRRYFSSRCEDYARTGAEIVYV